MCLGRTSRSVSKILSPASISGRRSVCALQELALSYVARRESLGRRSGWPLLYVATRQSHSAAPNRKRLSHACDHHSCMAQTANTNTSPASALGRRRSSPVRQRPRGQLEERLLSSEEPLELIDHQGKEALVACQRHARYVRAQEGVWEPNDLTVRWNRLRVEHVQPGDDVSAPSGAL